MEIFAGTPHPALRPHLAGPYWGWSEEGPPTRRVEVPQSGVVLVLSLGPRLAVDGVAHTSFIAGLYDVPVTLDHDGRQLGAQITFTPVGARTLLGLPLGELTRLTVEADAVLGPAGRVLEERLAGLSGWDARFAALDAFLLRRLAGAAPPRPDVAYAWTRLEATGGRATVGELCQALGCSRRHLAATMRAELGLPPKTLARLLRFERAVAGLVAGRAVADVAAACGYADQAHLTHEFRALADVTPRAYQRAVALEGAGRSLPADPPGSRNDKTGGERGRTVPA